MINKKKAQINKINEAAVLVSLYNKKKIISQKWFDTEKKAENFCAKYKYKICKMNENIDYTEMFNK